MKFPDWLPVFGDKTIRCDCPGEAAEQAAFFNYIRTQYPDTWGALALHPKNEGKRSGAGFHALAKDKALGMTPGAPDIVIPLGFACELKRLDHTKSKWQDGQLDYLHTHQKLGGFACVALGHKAAIEAFEHWLLIMATKL